MGIGGGCRPRSTNQAKGHGGRSGRSGGVNRDVIRNLRVRCRAGDFAEGMAVVGVGLSGEGRAGGKVGGIHSIKGVRISGVINGDVIGNLRIGQCPRQFLRLQGKGYAIDADASVKNIIGSIAVGGFVRVDTELVPAMALRQNFGRRHERNIIGSLIGHGHCAGNGGSNLITSRLGIVESDLINPVARQRIARAVAQ